MRAIDPPGSDGGRRAEVHMARRLVSARTPPAGAGAPPGIARESSQAPTPRRYRANATLIRLDRLWCSRSACRSTASFNTAGKLTPVAFRIGPLFPWLPLAMSSLTNNYRQ
jgi:hypothetical protein